MAAILLANPPSHCHDSFFQPSTPSTPSFDSIDSIDSVDRIDSIDRAQFPASPQHWPVALSLIVFPRLIILALLLMTASLPVASANPGAGRAAAAAARARTLLQPLLTATGLRLGDPVFIRIFKQERILELWLREPNKKTYRLLKTWPVTAVSGTLGPKLAEGDLQAPEGFYSVPRSALNPQSSFHLSFNLGFPNSYDRAHGRTGTFLMVHGSNLSAGCFAMTDPVIEEIYTLCAAALDNGQSAFPVHIFPFRMTPERLTAAADHPALDFWRNLQQGYDAFQSTRIPPRIRLEAKRYAIEVVSDQ